MTPLIDPTLAATLSQTPYDVHYPTLLHVAEALRWDEGVRDVTLSSRTECMLAAIDALGRSR